MRRSDDERLAEVIAWRASGKTLGMFSRGRGYSRSALEKWARAHRANEMSRSEPRFVRLEVAKVQKELVLEIGIARIRIERGFDTSLLREVVAALAGDAS